MGQEWDDILQEGSFDGVKFDFVSVRNSGSNDIDSQKFQGRKGTRRVGRGRNGTTWEILAVIIEDDYPQLMRDLVNVLDNGGAVKDFVHPIDGSTKAVCERYTVNHDAEDARDSCTISITLSEELIEDLDVVSIGNTTASKANKVRSLAQQVLEALSTFEAALEIQNNPIALEVIGAVNAAQGIADSLEATGDELSSLAVQSVTNSGLSQAEDAVVLLSDYDTLEQYDLSAAVQAMAAALRELALTIINAKPPLTDHDVVADTNLLALVFDIYGSSERVDEVLSLNSIPDPSLIPAGFKLRYYAA